MIFSYLLNMQSHPSWVCGLKLNLLILLQSSSRSHPSWVCGLKRFVASSYVYRPGVTPFVGVWIETPFKPCLLRSFSSHPSWVCGLKQSSHGSVVSRRLSHPSWVCGLKHVVACALAAWLCHTLRGCVD